MSWWAIDIRTAEESRELISAWLVAHTGHAVEERDDGTLVTVVPDEASAESLVARLGRELAAAAETTRRPLDNTDWSTHWRDGLGSRRFGRLTVVPSWVPEAAAPDPLTVVLDPETAFGSGEHGSTRVALSLLECCLRPGDRILDLGSGSGILAIAAIKLGAARAIGIENDAGANEVAARNAARNHVSDRMALVEGDAAVLAPLAGPADLVVSNILRSVNTELLPAIALAIRPGGIALFSGMEQSESSIFLETLGAAGFHAVRETIDSGWWGVAATCPP